MSLLRWLAAFLLPTCRGCGHPLTEGTSDIFDPASLVQAPRAQHPSNPGLVEALRQCTRVFRRTDFYIHFIDPADSNAPGSAWQHRESIRLQDEESGEVLVDLLTDD